MRIELRLFLWVIAIAVLAWSTLTILSIGRGGDEQEIVLPASGQQENVESADSALVSIAGNDDLEDISMAGRPLFSVAPSISSSTQPMEQEATLPILRGIVRGSDGTRAVFGGDSADQGYELVGVGGDFAGFEVVGIQVDRVTIRGKSDHVDRTLLLRASGEIQ